MLIGLGFAMAMNANKCIINNKGAIMGDRFVIVIEADNMRAHAAYLKGIADLDLIWPQLMAHAAVEDYKVEMRKKERDELRAKKNAEHGARMEKYRKEMAEYEEWKNLRANRFFPSGNEVKRPSLPDLSLFGPFDFIDYSYVGQYAHRYKSIRNELKHMADLAGAALGPYRMTEYKVKEMIAWEDGSRIEELKREAAGESMLEIY